MGDICNCCMYDSCGLQLCISYDRKDYYKKHPEEEPHYGTMYVSDLNKSKNDEGGDVDEKREND